MFSFFHRPAGLAAMFLACILAAPAALAEDADLLTERAITQIEIIADALETIEDEASARDAASDIAEASAALEEISAALEAEPEQARIAAIQGDMQRWMQAQQRLSAAMQKLMNDPSLMGIIGEEMADMPDLAP